MYVFILIYMFILIYIRYLHRNNFLYLHTTYFFIKKTYPLIKQSMFDSEKKKNN